MLVRMGTTRSQADAQSLLLEQYRDAAEAAAAKAIEMEEQVRPSNLSLHTFAAAEAHRNGVYGITGHCRLGCYQASSEQCHASIESDQ